MFEDLIPEFQPYAQWIVGAAADAGLQPRVTSTRRSRGLQKKLYDRFLRGESKYPALPPGLSAHEFGYAFDMIVTPESALDDVGYTWVQAGGIWGPGDAIHFEFPGFVPPPESRQNAIAEVAQKFNDLPWYETLLLPIASSTASGSLEEASKGSIGARILCSLRSSSFC